MTAARTAQLTELVATNSLGWDRQVGARGGQLSGGQKQRVAIARAIVKVRQHTIRNTTNTESH